MMNESFGVLDVGYALYIQCIIVYLSRAGFEEMAHAAESE